MRQFIIIFLVIFAVIWGTGVFFGYLSGFKYFKASEPPKVISSADQIETQKRLATESKESTERMMQDYKFQTQGLKSNFKTGTNLP